MNCIICKRGETAPGEATVTADRGGCTVVIKNVPADICQDCGEYYLSEETAQRVADIADQAEQSGTEVEVRRYAA